MIHPAAHISPTATVADDAEIGPNVIVGDGSVIGSGTKIMANAVVGPWTTIGKNNVIHYGAIVGHDPQDIGYSGDESYAKIGDGNIIREYATIHRGNRAGTVTTIGDGNFIMIQAHIAHNCEVGNNIVLAGGALLAGHVTVDDRVIISGNCVVHQFCRIGRLSMMRGLSRTSRDVPPFCIMDETHTVKSLNLIGLRRFGMDARRVRALKNAFLILFRGGLNMQNAMEQVETEVEMTDDVSELLEFIKNSKRGVCFGEGTDVSEFL